MIQEIIETHGKLVTAAGKLKNFRKTVNANLLLETRDNQKKAVSLERKYAKIYLEFVELVRVYPQSAKKALARLQNNDCCQAVSLNKNGTPTIQETVNVFPA